MAQLGFFANPEDAGEVREYDNSPVPEGWYEAEIRKAEILPTKAGGHRVNIQYAITGPTNTGRVVFGSINIDHPKQQVVDIGKEQLAQIARAIGKGFDDTDELVGKQIAIRVKIEQREGYQPSNSVVGYRASSSKVGSPAAKASGSTPPWVRK